MTAPRVPGALTHHVGADFSDAVPPVTERSVPKEGAQERAVLVISCIKITHGLNLYNDIY